MMQFILEFDMMPDFTKNAGDIVDDTIDQSFYEGVDAFVTAIKQATSSKYTTENRLGITEEKRLTLVKR